ncbi:VOC family protein [Ideonella azotifigens]|uniref:VOC domain-containing protein n=1 Tax=Ideonella azotifigens TaxID=513160 RepID=A0ABN1KBM7_9BURK|nr:VOC family protein [Ideonella azotifigens]MCD2341182.1 VOC family protein [Ideonella azotifigens]
MTASALPNLSHVGVFVHDLPRMVDFYTSVFGLKITDRGMGKTFRNELVFLSARPEQHHQLVLSSGRPAEAVFSTVMQLSFIVQALDDLRRVKQDALRLGASQMRGLNHGNALSIYFSDPEGNTVEVYLDTPYYVAQPHGDPLDLEKADAEIWTETERICRADPTFLPREEWQRQFSAESA